MVLNSEKDKQFFKRESLKSTKEVLRLSSKVKKLKSDQKDFRRSERRLKMLVSMIAEHHLDKKTELVSKIRILEEKMKANEEQKLRIVSFFQGDTHTNENI